MNNFKVLHNFYLDLQLNAVLEHRKRKFLTIAQKIAFIIEASIPIIFLIYL